MSMPPFALVAEQAPTETDLTDYDLKHFSTYLGLLDADADGVDWVSESASTAGRLIRRALYSVRVRSEAAFVLRDSLPRA